MKNLFVVLFGLMIVSCNQSKKEISNKQAPEAIKPIENFDWLLGEWERVDEEEGKYTFENWDKIRETEYLGFGFTLQNGDTIKQEKMRLIKTRGHWKLTVKVPQESEKISFKMIKHSENDFTCENKEIDFPNKIRYWKNGANINALVSNTEMKIPFEFKKRSK